LEVPGHTGDTTRAIKCKLISMQNIYVVYSDITTVPRNLHDEILSYTYIES